jgi:hypothetical protein
MPVAVARAFDLEARAPRANTAAREHKCPLPHVRNYALPRRQYQIPNSRMRWPWGGEATARVTVEKSYGSFPGLAAERVIRRA